MRERGLGRRWRDTSDDSHRAVVREEETVSALALREQVGVVAIDPRPRKDERHEDAGRCPVYEFRRQRQKHCTISTVRAASKKDAHYRGDSLSFGITRHVRRTKSGSPRTRRSWIVSLTRVKELADTHNRRYSQTQRSDRAARRSDVSTQRQRRPREPRTSTATPFFPRSK